MSIIGSYKNTAFSESQKFLVLDPETGSTSLVRGSSLVSYIAPRLNSVIAETTRLSAENTDYAVGEIIQTSGAESPGDNFAAVYLVVEGGSGDFPMLNGNDLLVIRGDEFLREQLISEDAGEGASLVSMEGGPTVEEAVNNRVIRVSSRTEMKAYDVPAGYQFSLEEGGRSGRGVVKSGTPPSDPEEGFYVVLNNGNYWERIDKDPVNAKWFGATGDGSTDDTVALQAAIDLTTDSLYIPEGRYITSDALVVDDQINIFGEGSQRTTGKGTQIRNEGSNEGLIYSNTTGIYDRSIKDIGITSVNGHALHLRYGCIRCEFLNLRLDSRSINHSAIFGDYTSYGIGVFTNRFVGGEYFGSNTQDRNVPIVDFLTDRTLVNENVFRDMWVSFSKGIMAFRIQATDPGVKITNTKFESITFEVCEGGLIRLSQCSHTKIDGVSAWDSPTYTANLITLDDCTNTTIINYGRIGGTPDPGIVDILAQGTGGGLVVINFADVGAADEAINWGGQTGNYIGTFSSTRNDLNASRVVFVEGDNVKAPNIISPNHTAEDGENAVLSATGDAQARLFSEHSGTTRRLNWDANSFYGGNGALYPSDNELIDLGASTLKWKTVHAVNYRAGGNAGASGTFTTSDGKTVTVTGGIITNIV